MNDAKSPLYSRTVPCPACGAKSGQADFKTGMYVEEEREADQHVTRYRWLKADLTPLHPPFYALAHCPECSFTDFKEDFFEPDRSRENRVRVIAPRLKAELTRRGSVISILHQRLQPGLIDFPIALRLHLLAIAIQELLPEARRDHLKIARLYLRTAWLYRERAETAQPSLVESEGLVALDQFAAILHNLRDAADRLETVYSGASNGMQVAAVTRQVDGLAQGYADLRVRLLHQGDDKDPLGFLALLRGEWPAVPTGEIPCLEASVQAFEQEYQRGEGDTFALLKLMIELNYRLGNFDRVMEYASSVGKNGHEERAKLQRQLAADRSLSPEDRKRLAVRINRITASLQLASEIRQEARARQAAASTA